MKYLFTLLVVMQFNLAFAGTFPALIVSTTNPSGDNPLNNIVLPTAGQSFSLWRQINLVNGITMLDNHIDIVNNEVDIFVETGNGVVFDPPVPDSFYTFIAEFNGLSAGNYNLNYYSVPTGNTFPPSAADAPMFFVETIQFSVLGGGVSEIDASSKLSLSILMLFIVLSLWVLANKTNIKFS